MSRGKKMFIEFNEAIVNTESISLITKSDFEVNKIIMLLNNGVTNNTVFDSEAERDEVFNKLVAQLCGTKECDRIMSSKTALGGEIYGHVCERCDIEKMY